MQGNCTLFQICGDGGHHLFTLSCPPGLHFDVLDKECQYPFETTCQRPCGEVLSTTEEERKTTEPPTPPYWPCNIPEPCQPLTLYGDPEDCSSVHLCLGSGTSLYSFKCSGTLVFDIVSKDCINAQDATCQPKCNTATSVHPTTTEEQETTEDSSQKLTRHSGKW